MQFELEIIKLVPPGDGMGYYSGKTVFVPATLPGDVVRVYSLRERKHTITASLQEVLTPAAERRQPECPHTMVCGGCSLMHLDYERQLAVKQQMLGEVLHSREIELNPPVQASPVTARFRYKSRVRCVDGRIGFSGRNSNRVVEIPECRILSPGIRAGLERLSQLGRSNAEFQLLESRSTGETAVSIQSGRQLEPLPGFTQSLRENYGYGELTLHSHGFVQSNPFVTAEIIGELLQWVEGSRSVCELFCGCGTFSLPLAARVNQLTGFDVSELSIRTAGENAGRLGLENTGFNVADLNRIKTLPSTDTIVVDPPRKGLGDKLCRLIAKSKAEKLLYVSCNPASMARDLKTLSGSGGFEIRDLKGFDMYCHTTHLELMAVLIR